MARFCSIVAAIVLTACHTRASTAPPYAVEGRGRPASIAATTDLSWLGGEGSGLILNAEICGGEAFLLAPSARTVQVADLASGVIHRRIGEPGNQAHQLRRPVTFAVDCRREFLYVVESQGGILAFNIRDGRFADAYAHSPHFRASMGSRAFVIGDGNRILFGGLWASQLRHDWSVGSQMFEAAKLGLDWPVRGSAGAPIMEAYNAGCETDLTACLRVDLVPRFDAPGWVVAQGGSATIAIVDSTGAVVRTIDIRSPKFIRDGTTPGAGTEAQIKWGEHNSTIWGVYSFEDVIAVVHAHHATRNWQRGQVVQFNVFMNLVSPTGDLLVSDVLLPDLPVGQHDGNLLVVDYGAAGRRPNAATATLMKIPLRQSFHEPPR